MVVGTSGDNAFRWTRADGMQGLPLGHAVDTSADGTFVLARSTMVPGMLLPGTEYAARWSAASGVEWLGSLPSASPNIVPSFYEAMALSADGSSAVGTFLQQRRSVPWIGDQSHGRRALADVLREHGFDSTGWDLRTLAGISGDGKTVVGWGGLAGRQVAFIARLP